MKQHRVLVLFLAAALAPWALIACGDDKPEEFIRKKEQEKKFEPLVRLGQSSFHEGPGVILLPRVQNFIRLDGKRYRIAVTIDRKLSRSFSDRDIVNYEWRRVRSVGEKFRRLFKRDMLVLRTYSTLRDFDADTGPATGASVLS